VADVSESASEVDEWHEPATTTPGDAVASTPVQEAATQKRQLRYPDVEAFVTEWLVDAYRRGLDGRGRTWCPQWWQHVEALSRIEAMWRAFEYLRQEPALGMSTWWQEHADPHMAVLLDPEGPFRYCDPEKGHSARIPPLPVEKAPEGHLTDYARRMQRQQPDAQTDTPAPADH